MDVPAQRALSHMDPAGLAGKAPRGYLVPVPIPVLSPKLLWKFLFTFYAGSWASSTELQARHPPRLSLRPADLAASCQCSTATKLIMVLFLND